MSAPQSAGQDTEADRSGEDEGSSHALRCGRSCPPLHLIEADATLLEWWWMQKTHRGLCGVQLTESTPMPDFEEDCPGCRDCLRYCAKCVRAAVDWGER